MFCSECGKKNVKGSTFCEKCGAKLEDNSKNEKIRKPMSKKQKVLLFFVILIVVSLSSAYLILKNMTDPKNVAKKYFLAVTSYNADEIYDFLELNSSPFTSKKIFKSLINKEKKDKQKVINYNINDAEISDDKMSATVKIKYYLDNEDDADYLTVKLVKAKENKWLIFDNWRVSINNIGTIKDYQMKVIKGSEVTVEGVLVKDKYIDEDESSDIYDVYKMPEMFSSKYNIEIKTPFGKTVKDEINVNSYSSYRFDLSMDSFSEKELDKISDIIKDNLNLLYKSIIDDKSFDDVKKKFEYKNSDLTYLKKDYESLKSGLSTYNKLTKYEVKKVDINSIKVNSNGKLEVYANINYDYTVNYKSGDEEKTSEKSNSDYSYLTFDYVDGSYKLIDTSSLETYFSR